MQYDSIDGLDKKISKLIMGNDNQIYFDEAAKLWDHWIEVGGNAFDNAHIYGQGSMEKLLGDWHRKRDNLKDLVIIAKGAHTPNCDPKSITSQLTESLDRLQTETADIYIMHRDNTEIPVDEFLGDDESLSNNGTSRRDFLKFLGFSVAAATVAACETPVIKAVPYVMKPENVTPGMPTWYASTYYDGSSYASIIVKTREARPIFIKGNADFGF